MAVTINADTTNGLVITPDTSGELEFQNNGTKTIKFGVNGLELPTWTTATRPSSPIAGTIGYNTTTGEAESFASGKWAAFRQNPKEYALTYMLVAGGGSGGRNTGGGGGAGGMISSTSFTAIKDSGDVYTITIGAGGSGAGSTSNSGADSTISATVISTITAVGGGRGQGAVAAQSGGSGGGIIGSTTTYATGVSGQGNRGGKSLSWAGNYGAGGGGGAGAVGGDGTNVYGGNGGIGRQDSITGTATYYAGGGGGGVYVSNNFGQGGQGGGADGTDVKANNHGTANTGGGGGGSCRNQQLQGNGGSGICILKIPTASYSGTTTGSPTVTTDGDYTILTYTSSGTYTG